MSNGTWVPYTNKDIPDLVAWCFVERGDGFKERAWVIEGHHWSAAIVYENLDVRASGECICHIPNLSTVKTGSRGRSADDWNYHPELEGLPIEEQKRALEVLYRLGQ